MDLSGEAGARRLICRVSVIPTAHQARMWRLRLCWIAPSKLYTLDAAWG